MIVDNLWKMTSWFSGVNLALTSSTIRPTSAVASFEEVRLGDLSTALRDLTSRRVSSEQLRNFDDGMGRCKIALVTSVLPDNEEIRNAFSSLGVHCVSRPVLTPGGPGHSFK